MHLGQSKEISSPGAYRKQVIIPLIIDLELSGKVLEGIKSMRSAKSFIIFTAVAFCFVIMTGHKWPDQFVTDPYGPAEPAEKRLRSLCY